MRIVWQIKLTSFGQTVEVRGHHKKRPHKFICIENALLNANSCQMDCELVMDR